MIGESIGSVEGFMGSLRGLDDVVVCPDDLFGEGHSDGRIWSTFGWAMRGILGAERSDAIWYTTMASLSGGVTLAQGTATVLATVASEVAMGHVTAEEQTMIMAAAEARGLPDCTMFVPIDDGLSHSGYSGNSFVTAGLSHGLAPLQYTVQVPPDVINVEVDVGHGSLAGMTTVHFMNDVPVRGSGSRVTSGHSQAIPRIGTASYSRTDGLAPCSTLYIGIETTDLRTAGESLYTIQARINTTHETRACPRPQTDGGLIPDAGHDASMPDAGPDASMTPTASSGCGCGVGARSSGAGWAVVMLALVLARRRR
jgi:MYXO-CTERM domain-containing protein